MMNLENKKVLVVGLGLLGGGVSTVKWLIDQGAEITVTDLKSEEELKSSIESLGPYRKEANFILGEHRKKDFKSHDIIVVNPAVKIKDNSYLEEAYKSDTPVVNDLILFLNKIKTPVVAVTGTRGKTTTTNWIAHFLSKKFPDVRVGGNSSDWPLLGSLPELNESNSPAVVEVSSFQLEIVDNLEKGPDVAVITNLYRDHLNHHETMGDYMEAKANIFKNQTEDQKLILNKDKEWTDEFLSQNPKSKVYFISKKKLPDDVERGLFVSENKLFLREGGEDRNVLRKKNLETIKNRGEHNLENFLTSSLASYLSGASWGDIEEKIKTLPQIEFRQQVIIDRNNLTIINDTTSTSPDAAMAAIDRFGGDKTILIAGGTDKNLDYSMWAMKIKESILPQNLFLLSGTSTDKMIEELQSINYFKDSSPQLFDDFKKILTSVKDIDENITILFSPGAASFGKFENEFDRGRKFNKYVEEIFSKNKSSP